MPEASFLDGWSIVRRKIVLTRDATAGSVTATIQADNTGLIVIDRLNTGPDDYQAARSVQITVLNSAGTRIGYLGSVSVDNQGVGWGPDNGTGNPTANGVDRLAPGGSLVLYPGDKLEVSGVSLAAAETLTIWLRARVIGKVTISATSSSTTIATTEA